MYSVLMRAIKLYSYRAKSSIHLYYTIHSPAWCCEPNTVICLYNLRLHCRLGYCRTEGNCIGGGGGIYIWYRYLSGTCMLVYYTYQV